MWKTRLAAWLSERRVPVRDGRKPRQRPRPAVERLEDRTVPSTFAYQAVAPTTNLLLGDSGGKVFVWNATTHAVLASAPLAGLTAVQITGAPGAATSLRVDLDDNLNTLPISFAGQSGADSLTVVDETTATGEVYTLNVGSLGLSTGGQITWTNTANITVNGDGGGNTFNVQGTDMGSTFTLNTGAGNDVVNLGDANNTFLEMGGTLTVNGQAGQNAINFNIQGDNNRGAASDVIMYGDHVQFDAGAGTYPAQHTDVYFSGVQGVRISSAFEFGTIPLLFEIVDHSAVTGNVHYTLNNGNYIELTNTLQTLVDVDITGVNTGTINNRIDFLGVGSILAVNCDNVTYRFHPGGFIAGLEGFFGTSQVLDFSALAGPITVDLGPANTVAVAGHVPGVLADYDGMTEIIGTSGSDTLVAPGQNDVVSVQSNQWSIYGTNEGTVAGITFKSFENLVGGIGPDTFAFISPRGRITGTIDGVGAFNTLDYSAVTGNVLVDLPLGTASLVGGGVANIQNVVGSNGNDILVGDGQNNFLFGGTGRNLLIAGAGPGTLIGNSGDDILIGGSTAYDTNVSALNAILAEWVRTDITYSQRVNHLLSGGGLNGSFLLNASTVTGNGGGNTLSGNGGNDFYFGNPLADFNDFNPATEVFVSV